MRVRVAVATVATVVGVALLSRFKTPDQKAGATGAQPAPVPTTESAPDPSSSPATDPAPVVPGPRDGTYTGQDVYTRFGDVEVKVVIAGHRIADVKPVLMPYDHQRSAYISRVAGPWLRDEVLKAQSAQIDTVSGATYTSDAYAESVQAALDQAGSAPATTPAGG